MKILNWLFYACLLFGAAVADQDKECARLEKAYKRGFLKDQERGDYCLNGCSFLRVNCGPSATSRLLDLTELRARASKIVVEMETWLNNFNVVNDPFMYTMHDVAVDEATLEAWSFLFANSWTILLCVIPVVLNQWKYYNYVTATACLLIFMVCVISGVMPFSIAVHNFAIGFLCFAHSGNSSHLVESIWTMGVLCIAFFATFMTDRIWHIVILVMAIIGFFSYIHWCFFVRRSGMNAGLVIVICQLFVLIEQMEFARQHLAALTLGGAALEMGLNAIVPYGRSSFLFVNTATIAATIAVKLQIPAYIFASYVFAFVTQIVMFIAFRASLGAFYLHILRYRTDVESLVSGLFVYTIDFWGPFVCLNRMLFRYENYQTRRFMYAVIGILLSYYEYTSAYEFFMLKFTVSTIDSIFLRSRYGRTTHYLQFPLDFLQSAFPQTDAPPWQCVETISKISSNVHHLYATRKGSKTVRGVCTVLVSGGRSMLYTVRHVVSEVLSVTYDGKTLASPDFRAVSNGDDPMMSMKVEEEGAPEIELLTPDEAYDVKHLMFVNVSGDERYMCNVGKFTLVGGRLHASVNLRKGDSGGPCFAVLENGEVRLCGVVSTGNPRSGGGNIISFCYHNNEIGADSSEEESLGDVTQFNRTRRVRFASDDPERIRYRAGDDLNKFIENNRELFEDMKGWKRHIVWNDLENDVDDVVQILYDENHEDLELRGDRDGGQPDNDRHDDDGDDGAGGRKKHKKKDQKARNKDKAYRKRAFALSELLAAKLRLVYSEADCESIFNAIVNGHVPSLMGRRYINSTNGYDWVVSDDLPSPDHT